MAALEGTQNGRWRRDRHVFLWVPFLLVVSVLIALASMGLLGEKKKKKGLREDAYSCRRPERGCTVNGGHERGSMNMNLLSGQG